MRKEKEFNCSGKITLHFRAVERGSAVAVSDSHEITSLLKQYFIEMLSADSDFLKIDKLKLSELSYIIEDI